MPTQETYYICYKLWSPSLIRWERYEFPVDSLQEALHFKSLFHKEIEKERLKDFKILTETQYKQKYQNQILWYEDTERNQ